MAQLKAAAHELRHAETSAALACEAAAWDADAARGGALVRGAGGSRVGFTTGFGTSFTTFFGFGFGLGGGIRTTSGLGAGASSGTGITCGCSTTSGSASVICGPGVTSGGVSLGGATSRGASSIITTDGGSPADRKSRTYKIQKTIAAWTRTTATAANNQRRSDGSSSTGKTRICDRVGHSVGGRAGNHAGGRHGFGSKGLASKGKGLAGTAPPVGAVSSMPTSPILR